MTAELSLSLRGWSTKVKTPTLWDPSVSFLTSAARNRNANSLGAGFSSKWLQTSEEDPCSALRIFSMERGRWNSSLLQTRRVSSANPQYTAQPTSSSSYIHPFCVSSQIFSWKATPDSPTDASILFQLPNLLSSYQIQNCSVLLPITS